MLGLASNEGLGRNLVGLDARDLRAFRQGTHLFKDLATDREVDFQISRFNVVQFVGPAER
jgi:hypothetical protein